MHLLESGLHDYGVEVTILCLESIEGVAVCRRKDEALQSSPALTHILEHFLKVHVHVHVHVHNVLYTSTCTVTCTCTQCTCIIMIVHVQSCMRMTDIALHVIVYTHTCCMFPIYMYVWHVLYGTCTCTCILHMYMYIVFCTLVYDNIGSYV